MPGTIQVSVLELLDLPSSSISVKVSMGMKEHQVWDKGGEFSFPLTTLRDNLIVALYDIEGNELSRTGMSTKLVVEKGIWEDRFPLEGGGQLHMKLQFILSDKERKRIRDMRETALKKKQEELLTSGARLPEMPSVTRVGPNVVAAFNHEVTDSRDAQRDTVSIGGNSLQGRAMLSHIIPVTYPEFGPEKTEEIRFGHTGPTNTEGRKRTPAEAETSQDYKGVRLAEVSQQIVKTSDSQSPPDGVPAELISSERTVEYSKTPIKNDTVGTKGTSSVPMPLQDHNSYHLTIAARKLPVTINTQSPPMDITTSPSSSQNQTHITVKQVSLEKFPRTNETDREESSSEVTQQIAVKIDTQSPPMNITTRSNSLQNQSHSTIKHIALERTPRDNETDRQEVSSQATQKILVEVDTQAPPNDITTGPNTLHNQTHRTIKQIVLEKNPGNNEADGEETPSEATRQVPTEVGTRAQSYYTTTSSFSQNQTHSTIKQIALVKITSNNDRDIEGASAVTQMSEEQKISDHTETTLPLTEKTDIHPTPNVVPTKFISSKKDLEKSKFVLGEKLFSASRPSVENQTHGSENQTASTKTPTSVRKLISALESSQPQGSGPRFNAPKLKFNLSRVKSESSMKGAGANEVHMENSKGSKQNLDRELIAFSVKKPLEVNAQLSVPHLNTIKTEVPLGGPCINEVMKESNELNKQIIEGALNPFSLGNVRSQKQVNLDAHIAEASDSLSNSQTTKPIEVSDEKPVATAGTNLIKQVDSNIQHKDENNNRHEELFEDSAVTSDAETATISGRILDDPTFKEHIHAVQQSSRMLDAIPAGVEGINTREQVDCNIQHKKENRNRQESFLDEFVVPSEAETATTPGIILEDPVRKVHTHDVHHEQLGSFFDVLDESEQRTNGDKSDEIKTSLEKQKSVEYVGVEQPDSEAVGSWILPGERSLCITTGSKQMMDFMEWFETSGQRNQRMTSLYRKGVGMEVASDSDTFVKEKGTETSSDNLRNSKLDRSEDDTVPGGLIGQAAKIVIAVAVGTLVVVLRGK